MKIGSAPIDLGGNGAAMRAAEALGDAIHLMLIGVDRAHVSSI